MAARRSQKLPKHRLDPGVRPECVRLHVDVDPSESRRFHGEVEIDLTLDAARSLLRLHALDLRVSRAWIEGEDGRNLRAQIVPQPKLEMVALRFDRKIPAGAATLRLAFSGKLRTDLCGLYGVTVGEREYAFTQLEATDARKFFPCFDEPTMKARFSISVATSTENTAISNAPVARTEKTPDGRQIVHFAETPPLSTYLIALAVGELESSRVVRAGPTAIRLWHTPGKGHLTQFGLEATRACLIRLERYFDLWYPYAKLDMVAVPDFEFGAMENAGAVFFRETLLLVDPERATLGEKKRAAEVICHELAHMWYGDLVTMAWWDDLWLNEAFATWMAFKIVDDWKPEWKMWHDFQHGRAAAMKQDALRHTHPIYCPVDTADEANENFDLITYEKGASVVRMLERYLGASKFRRGVRAYIREHREGNTVAADLWCALSAASGVEVERIARSWIAQDGYPAIDVRVVERDDGFHLQLRQDRFYQRPPGRPATTKWAVPWVGRIGRGRKGSGQLVRHLLTKKRDEIALGERAPRFVYGNADEGGFFRPAHAPAELAALGRALPSLAAVERMGLVDHQWALVCAGRAPIGAFLDLAGEFAGEPDPDVLSALRQPLTFIADTLIPDACPSASELYRAWLLDHFAPAFAALGWTPARNEPDELRVRRAVLLGLVGGAAADETVRREAARRCDAYLKNRRAVDANLADGVVALAARTGGKTRYRRFLAAARTSDTPQEQRRFLLAIADFRDEACIDETLALSLSDRVPTQDVIFLLGRLMANPDAREATWSFIKRRWPKLRKRMPSLFAGRLIEATPNLQSAEHRRDVARFFRENPVPAGDRALRQALERFDWYRGFRRKAATGLRDWLDQPPQG